MLNGFAAAVPDNSAAKTPTVHISYGQSWRSLTWDGIGTFSLNPQAQTLLAIHYTNPLLPSMNGPLSNGAGISLQTGMDGVTGYSTSDQVSVGRCAVLAYHLTCIRDGNIPLNPVLEFCAAWPSSTWTSGGGGGLGPGSSSTGSITNNVLTVGSDVTGHVVVNQLVSATGVDSATVIVSQGTGTGGAGTYNVDRGQFIVSEAMTASGGASFTGQIDDGVAAAGCILHASGVTGTISATNTVTGSNVLANTKIVSQQSGTAGKDGDYLVTVGTAQTVGSRTIATKGRSWANMLTIISTLEGLLPNTKYPKLNAASFKSVGYTQGGATDDTRASKVNDLTEMLTAYDALNLPGAGTTTMKYYLGLPSAISTATVFDDSMMGTYDFCRTNAPGQGGTWSGRCFATAPSYPWEFNGADNIHTGPYGTCRWGEWEGSVKKWVEVDGIAWTPLWRPLTGGAITVAGQVVTIPWARPAGPTFANGVLSFKSQADDGLQDFDSKGFRVRRGGAFLTITDVSISGLNVLLTVGQTLNGGDTLEISYAQYGPGGPSPGIRSGVGGNLVMEGPSSVLFPSGYNGNSKTLDAWAWPFLENVTI